MKLCLTTCAAFLVAGCIGDPVPKTPTDADATTLTDTDTASPTDTADADADVDTDATEPTTAPTDTVDDGDADADAEVDATASPLALTLTQEATRWTVANQRVAVGFDEVAGWQPRTLASPEGSGLDVLYGDLAQTHEAWVGVSVWDLAHAWRSSVPPTVREQGPAIVRFDKAWEDADRLDGTTTTTVHADGRVVIAHDLRVLSQGGEVFVAYVALAINRITQVFAGTERDWTVPTGRTFQNGVEFLTIEDLPELTDVPYLCARDVLSRDVVGWVARSVAGLPALLPRITENAVGAPSVHSIRLQYDFARQIVNAGVYAGRFLLMIDGTGSCDRLALVAQAFRAPPALTPAVGLLRTTEPGDADADGFVEAGGFYAVSASTRAFQGTFGAALPGTTVRVVGPGWAGTPTVRVGGSALEAGVDFVAQPASAGEGGWVVVLGAIEAGQTLDISW